MAVVAQQAKPMTYEDYLAEGEVEGRYDIINGARYFMTSPSRRHQRILVHLTVAFMRFEILNGGVRVFVAPSDLLIPGDMLQVRQPDMFIISLNRLEREGDNSPGYALSVPPELAVEVLSSTEPRRSIEVKLQDYARFGIDECWLISPEGGTVEVVARNNSGYATTKIYGVGSTAASVIFPDLIVNLDEIFAP